MQATVHTNHDRKVIKYPTVFVYKFNALHLVLQQRALPYKYIVTTLLKTTDLMLCLHAIDEIRCSD